MPTKSKLAWILGPALCLGLSACTIEPMDTDLDNIGAPLKEVSNMSIDSDAGKSQIALFDKTAQRIHKFDLEKMTHLDTYEVKDPAETHYVFFASGAQYLIDLSKKRLSIIKENGDRIENPIRLQGDPVSASYHEGKGYFILYDSYNNAGILKLSPTGDVLNKKILGTEITDGKKIQSGDIDNKGDLIVSLANGEMAKIDIEATLSSGTWSYTPLTVNITYAIRWVAKVPGQDNQVLIHDNLGSAYLVDTTNGVILSQLTDQGAIHMSSRNSDPHLVVKSNNRYSVIYPEASVLKTKSVFLNDIQMTESYLSASKGSWGYVSTRRSKVYGEAPTKEFAKYLLNQGMATDNVMPLPSKSIQRISENFVFSLVESKLGYAIRNDLHSESKLELKHFNVKHIKPR